MTAKCFDCERHYRVIKNDKLCPDCEISEWERQRAKGAATRKSRKPRSLAVRVAPIVVAVQPMRSLAMRLFGKRAEKP